MNNKPLKKVTVNHNIRLTGASVLDLLREHDPRIPKGAAAIVYNGFRFHADLHHDEAVVEITWSETRYE